MIKFSSIALPFLFIAAASAYSQDLPKEIRGYKVHREKVTVSAVKSTPESPSEAFVKIGDPKLFELDVTGLTFELPAEITSAKQSGKIDFLTFNDIKVNAISVDIDEYRHPFEFKKGELVSLPKPARIFLPITGLAQAVWKEMRDSKPEWTVAGRVFVFGRFRRYGFYHKRVVPIDFEIKIKNPLK